MERNKKTSKASQKQFELAMQMVEAGYKPKEVATALNFKPATIRLWKKFSSWDKYCEYKKAMVEKGKKSPKTEKLIEESEKKVDESFATLFNAMKETLSQLLKIQSRLLEIEEEKLARKQNWEEQKRKQGFLRW